MTAPGLPLQQSGDIDLRDPKPQQPVAATAPAPTDTLRDFAKLSAAQQKRIRANVQIMQTKGAHPDEIDSYLSTHERLRPVAGWTAPTPAPASTAPSPAPSSAPSGIPRLLKPGAPTRYDGSAVTRGFPDAVLHGASFGLSDEIGGAANAVGDALKAKVRGGEFGSTFSKAYDANVTAERAALDEYAKEHPVANAAGEILGSVATLPFVGARALGGAARAAQVAKAAEAAGEVASATRAARLGRAAVQGAKVGALFGAGNSEGGVTDRAEGAVKGGATGALVGAASEPVVAGAGYVARKLGVPTALNKVATAAANTLPAESKPQVLLRRIASATGAEGEANREVASRVAMDKSAGHTPAELPPEVPGIALDRGGPNVVGLAENIANRPGAGKSALVKTLTDRQALMRPAVTAAFDQGTGTTAEDGHALLQRLADEHGARQSATQVTAAVAKDAKGAVPAAPNHASAWEQETSGTSNAIAALRAHVDERSSEAARLYGEARATTAGQPVQSETLDKVLETPAGKAAYSWALAQKSNRGSALATVPGKEIVPQELSAEEWATTQQRAKDRGMPVPSFGRGADQSVPDPETLHYMKQHLARTARLGVNDGAQGTIATQAQGALGLWSNIRNELPDAWRAADDAYASKSRTIDHLNLGRDILRTQLNPVGKKALYTSLDAVEQRVAKADPIDQHAFRVGAQSAMRDLFQGGISKNQLAQLADPKSAFARRVALATGDQDAPARLSKALAPRLQQIPAPPPIAAPSAESQAAARGLDVLRHGETAPSTAPGRSLAVLSSAKTAMPPSEQAALQRGAAQAVRGEWEGAPAKLRTPGSVFAASPERVEQVGHAFPTPAAASDFQQTVKAWDALQGRLDQILGNSRTAARGAEEAARDKTSGSVVRHALHGNFGSAVGALVGGASKDATNALRQKTDAEIAKILASPDASALDKAEAAARVHGAMKELLQRFGAQQAAHAVTGGERR
ncbi:MAG: hypothetical protein JWM41_2915 [Gemmatimonadetes bacterium]|nr:hypothetical protein [Gemmatimonadota bacterium]